MGQPPGTDIRRNGLGGGGTTLASMNSCAVGIRSAGQLQLHGPMFVLRRVMSTNCLDGFACFCVVKRFCFSR